MSDVEVRDAGTIRRKPDEVPVAMVLAVVCGAGVAVLWGIAALVLFMLVRGFEGGGGAPWMLACVFATVMNFAGIIGCARRWGWVRWAALPQAVVVSVALVASVGWAPFVPWVIGLFVAYAGLQFLPSSHRWYHPVPR